MKLNVAIDSGSEDATVLTREVHIATYKGENKAEFSAHFSLYIFESNALRVTNPRL
jgi:hypothetical protein